jgi:hypothetical protein
MKVLDIGIWMRPDVLQRKSSGRKASWYFRDGWVFEDAAPGGHVWVCVADKWVGYFTTSEVKPESFEVVWNPSSWVAVDTRPSYEAKEELRHGLTRHVPIMRRTWTIDPATCPFGS